MTDRRYNDEEIEAIFRAAAEQPQTPQLNVRRNEGLTLTELQDIGQQVGIAPDAVAQAARVLDLQPQVASSSFLGLRIAVERSVELNRWITEEEWEHLVVQLREVFKARGTVASYGSLRQWTNGNLQALLEPTATGHRLRLATLNGNARGSMIAGLATVGIAGATAAAVAVGSGNVIGAAPGILFLTAVGLGMFANGALRLPGWARLRGRQMEAISTRLALSAGPPPQRHSRGSDGLPRPTESGGA